METLFDDKYNKVLFDKAISLHYNINKAATIYMSEEQFKTLLFKWKTSVFNTQPRLILVDNRALQFPVSPDLQLWTVENISTPVLEMPVVEKFCFVMPEEFISNLSIAQLTGEANIKTGKNKIRYFSNLEEAKAWLTI